MEVKIGIQSVPRELVVETDTPADEIERQLTLDFVRRGVGLDHELAWHRLNSDLYFHGAPPSVLAAGPAADAAPGQPGHQLLGGLARDVIPGAEPVPRGDLGHADQADAE